MQLRRGPSGASTLIKQEGKGSRLEGLADLRPSRSNQLRDLDKNADDKFGGMASLRKSRLLLNKHLEDKAKELAQHEKLRKEEHETFHKAIRSTGQTLDHLARQMQGDLQHQAAREVLRVRADNPSSLIEHELRKKSLYDGVT